MTLKSVTYAVIINLAKPIARNVRWLLVIQQHQQQEILRRLTTVVIPLVSRIASTG